MKIKSVNGIHDVYIERGTSMGKKSVNITVGHVITGLVSVAITEEDWDRFKKEV